MECGRIVRSVVGVTLAMELELIQKQNGHEVRDFVNQIEDAYRSLNGLSMATKQKGPSV
jgi:hypothetical protein